MSSGGTPVQAVKRKLHGNESARVRRFPANLRRCAPRKLDLLNVAADVNDLRAPPSNHVEDLSGGLAGFGCIRVDDQWRIVFRWNMVPHGGFVADRRG